MKILIIDNYDSFTFNLYQCVGEILTDDGRRFQLAVFRNDAITIEEIKRNRYDKIIISPGPGNPSDPAYFGVCASVLTKVGKKTPVLGVCLGMQGMAYYYGGKVIRARRPMHGKTSIIEHDATGIFRNLPQHIAVMRYHSLIADKQTLPDCLQITAQSLDTKEIMALRHKTYPIEGIQFHPESFATEGGKSLLKNFLFQPALTWEFVNKKYMYIQNLLHKLVEKENLTIEETRFLLDEIIAGNVLPTEIAAFLIAFHMKGESKEEIIGFIQAMREKMLTIHTKDAIDVCGTGGDSSGTFNISTAVAFVVVGAGVKVAKHGNRAASSKCGSADVLEKLGININLNPKQAEIVFKKVGMVFLFAPLFHPALKNVVTVRKELKIRTIFNFLGPFANPALVKKQLIGVPNLVIAKKLAEVGKALSYEHLLVATSLDGLDEISIFSKSIIFVIKNNRIKKMIIDPKKYGYSYLTPKEILGGDVTQNAIIIKDILQGKKGVKRDIVVLNSAIALFAADKVNDIKTGITMAEKSIDSGNAKKVLKNLIKETQKYA